MPFFDSETNGNAFSVPNCLAEKNESKQKLLDSLLEECTNICVSADIKVGKVVSIIVNEKLCNAWGRCIFPCNSSGFTIELNKDLLKESVPISSIKKVILHELCHTVPDGDGHKKGWKKAVEKLKPFGYQLTRCSSAKELRVPEKSNDEYKYVFRCQGCGILIRRFKASKFVRNYGRYKCGMCGGKFERIS